LVFCTFMFLSMVWDLSIYVVISHRILVSESAIWAAYQLFCLGISAISGIISVISAHIGSIVSGNISTLFWRMEIQLTISDHPKSNMFTIYKPPLACKLLEVPSLMLPLLYMPNLYTPITNWTVLIFLWIEVTLESSASNWID